MTAVIAAPVAASDACVLANSWGIDSSSCCACTCPVHSFRHAYGEIWMLRFAGIRAPFFHLVRRLPIYKAFTLFGAQLTVPSPRLAACPR